MNRIAARLIATGVAIGFVACSQSPSQPSPIGSTGSATIATVVDVPMSVDNTEGTVGTWNWAGQSVTIPPGGNVASVRFSWYLYSHRDQRVDATAFGRIYVLDREFLGVPGDLSPSMPGFLARSEDQGSGFSNGQLIQGAEYTLPESLVLTANTRYWFYTDTQGSFSYSFDKDLYAGGELYSTGYFSNPFKKSQASGRMIAPGVYVPPPPGVINDANFRLRGVIK